MTPSVKTTPHGMETPASKKKRAPAGDVTFASPDRKCFDILKRPTNCLKKTRSPRSTPPRSVWKPHPRRKIAGWLGLEYKANTTRPILDSEIPPCRYNSDHPKSKRMTSRIKTAPNGLEPQPHRPISDWLRLEKTPSAARRH